MPDDLVPGVYVEEAPARPRPIEGVPTSTAGFLGCTVRGPEAPRAVTSFAEFVRLYGGHHPGATPALTFAVEGFFQNGGQRCVIGRVVSRDAETLPDIEDYTGRDLGVQPGGNVARSGLAGFSDIDDISIVVAPDHHAVPMLTEAVIAHCATAGDRVAILHSHPDNDTPAAIDRIQPPQNTRDAAFYFPWIYVADSLWGGDVLVPPSGHIAGVYARTDSDRGVFKAPANQVVVGARALQFDITARQQDVLNPRGVNCLRTFPGRGILVWGARTASQDPEWKYINARRYLLFLQGSIGQGLAWAVFEHNDEPLWTAVRSLIEDFLLGQWRAGALMGTSPDEAFFVKVDRTTMTQNDIDNGRLIALIGVAVVRPAEYVIFRIEQWTADART